MTHPDPFFALPDRLDAKRDPALIAADAERFAAIDRALRARGAELRERLAIEQRKAGRHGQAALERDLEVHRLGAELRTLARYGVDLCLGRMVGGDGETTYIGRLGMAGPEGRRLLVDWRTPAAEPFFAATLAHPLGLVSRRRYRWASGRVVDYWDEALGDGADGGALDDQSAFIASLGASRSARMRDVLGTIQADQDAIIRADARGALVVDGGPGTGKTVVALHRAAYLLHADARIERGGVLVVGPHEPYLGYVADVLPSLGEEAVRSCTPADLVPEGRDAGEEADAAVAALKADGRMLDAVEALVAARERPPVEELEVDTDWARLVVDDAAWDEALAAAEPGVPHNDARDLVWEALVAVLHDRLDDDDVPLAALRRALAHDVELASLMHRTWPVLDPPAAVGALWSDPRLLARCAPWLAADEVALLQRDDPTGWTIADLPILDAAHRRIGDPEALRTRRRREVERAAERERMDRVVDELVEAEQLGDGEGLGAMLRGADVRTSLEDEASLTRLAPDALAGPFAHLVIDEAQELSDAQWRMLLARCPSGSVTVVGDRAQARAGFAEPWSERLRRAGLREVRVARLGVNYRTPEEVMTEAEPVIRAALPDANVPTSVRRSGVPVRRGRRKDLDGVLEQWLATHEDGTACVIGAAAPAHPRIRSLTPTTAKGLEFDLVVLVDPEGLGEGVAGAVDRYVAMTRTTRELVVLR